MLLSSYRLEITRQHQIIYTIHITNLKLHILFALLPGKKLYGNFFKQIYITGMLLKVKLVQ